MKRLELRIYGGGCAGIVVQVGENGARLGRSSSNDIHIRDEELSRNHCLFERSGETGLRLTDLASANGTFVNGTRLGAETVVLKAGDVVTVGSSRIEVVGEEKAPSGVDLGLGTRADAAKDAELPPVGSRRKPLANLLWAVTVVLLAVAAWLVLQTPGNGSRPESVAEPVVEPKLVEMEYEKVVADSESIFRYHMAMASDGLLRVTIDDMAGEGRHLNRSSILSDASRKRLLEILTDPSFIELDRNYTGADTEPPKLESWRIKSITTERRRVVRVANVAEPAAFRRVREKLEAFSMNELGIRALQYSRDDLIKMARTAAETGRMKWEDREVEYGNIHAAICAYREAIADLETVDPKPPEFAGYREALQLAETELKSRYDTQRFAAEQATSVGDWDRARNELRILCDMVPDRDDERNREAATKLMDVESRMKKGGRR